MPHPPSLPRYKTLSKCPSRCPSGKTPSWEPPIHVPLPGHIWISNGVLPGRMDGRHIWISNGVLPQHIYMDGVLPGHVDGKPHWISICACHQCAQAKPHPRKPPSTCPGKTPSICMCRGKTPLDIHMCLPSMRPGKTPLQYV